MKWAPVARVDKYDPDQVDYVRRESGLLDPDGDTLARYVKPYDSVEAVGNGLTTAGLNRMTAVLIGSNLNTLDSTRARLGVGDDVTAFNVADVDLSTGANQFYRVLDATYPQQANGAMSFKATYADAEANFAWQCWGIDVGAPPVASGAGVNPVLINRKVTPFGTKASGSWVLSVSITLA